MAADAHSKKLAVLIDADNASPNMAQLLLAEIAKFGTAHVKRAYADWTSPNMRTWKEQLLGNSIQPIQQFAYTTGKNATDAAMVIDAMDLLYTGRFDGFCIVTSDSDFTRLAGRLRESGLVVYGFGEKKTPQSLIKACDQFTYFENLRASAENSTEAGATHPPLRVYPSSPKPTAATVAGPSNPRLRRSSQPSSTAQPPAPGLGDNEAMDDQQQTPQAKRRRVEDGADATRLPLLVLRAIRTVAEDDGWAALAPMGHILTKWEPEFDPRDYGYERLSHLLRDAPMLEMEKRMPGGGKPPGQFLR